MLAGPTQHQGADTMIRSQGLKASDQRSQQCLVIGVANLRPVERHVCHTTRIHHIQDGSISHVITKFGSVLLPQTSTPTCAPGGGSGRG